MGFTVIREPEKSQEDAELMVNTFAVRDKHLEMNKVYEFFGEIEEVINLAKF